MSDYMRNRRGEESDSFFCRFTFGQFFALLVLEVFTLFFVFYLGARYGREFLGLDKAGTVAMTAETGIGGGEEGLSVVTTADPEAKELAKELVAKARTPELKERIAKMFETAGGQREGSGQLPPVVEINRGAQASSAASAPEAEPVAGPQAPPVQEEAVEQFSASEVQEAANNEKPEVLAKPLEPQGASSSSVVRVKSVENARYSVQVGSYPKMEEATRNVEKWKTKGYPAYVMIADIPDRGQWYRVRIGGFSSRVEATKYLTELKTQENVEALVVMNEQ